MINDDYDIKIYLKNISKSYTMSSEAMLHDASQSLAVKHPSVEHFEDANIQKFLQDGLEGSCNSYSKISMNQDAALILN